MKFKSLIEKYKFYLLLLIPLAIYFAFALFHLTRFETADEHLWIYDPVEGRINDYWRAIAEHDWTRTRVNDKPGITLAYVSGIGLLFEKNPEERIVQKEENYRIYDPAKTEEINLLFRLPILIFNGLFSFYFFWIIRKLTSSGWLALFSAALILLCPTLLGISQIVNPDSLLWVFSTAGILSFLTFLDNEEKKYALLSSAFVGLALLSKYTAVILMPYFFFLIELKALFSFKKWQENNETNHKIKLFSIAYYFIIFGSFALFSVLMPAVFRHPEFLFQGTIGFKASSPLYIFIILGALNAIVIFDAFVLKSKGVIFIFSRLVSFRKIIPQIISGLMLGIFVLVLTNWSLARNFLNLTIIPFDIAREPAFTVLPFWNRAILEVLPLVYSLTPLVLSTLIFAWAFSFWRENRNHFVFTALSSFFPIFYAAVLQQGLLVHVRYSVLFYPLAMILAAFGIYEFCLWLKMKERWMIFVFLVIIMISSLSLWLSRPFYFNYTNDLLPKDDIITGAWGYGGWEAAEFLNRMPDARNLVVWSDYHGFCSFFAGKCVNDSAVKDWISKNRESSNGIDYFVATRRGRISNRKTWNSLEGFVDTEKPVWEMVIDGHPDNYVRIYQKFQNKQ